MSQSKAERTIRDLFLTADVIVGGGRSWDITVHDAGIYPRLLAEGSMGLGETYMDGGWDCERIDEMISRIVRSGIEERVRVSTELKLQVLRNKITNPQTRRRSLEVGRRHYDAGNDLYATMLDDEMTYSCGYWRNATTLDQAQQAKLRLICE